MRRWQASRSHGLHKRLCAAPPACSSSFPGPGDFAIGGVPSFQTATCRSLLHVAAHCIDIEGQGRSGRTHRRFSNNPSNPAIGVLGFASLSKVAAVGGLNDCVHVCMCVCVCASECVCQCVGGRWAVGGGWHDLGSRVSACNLSTFHSISCAPGPGFKVG